MTILLAQRMCEWLDKVLYVVCIQVNNSKCSHWVLWNKNNLIFTKPFFLGNLISLFVSNVLSNIFYTHKDLHVYLYVICILEIPDYIVPVLKYNYLVWDQETWRRTLAYLIHEMKRVGYMFEEINMCLSLLSWGPHVKSIFKLSRWLKHRLS